MASEKVIVFGPTGAVGSSAALTAEKLGCEVVLAMRTIDKPIRGLSTEEENSRRFRRIKADLMDPKSVESAVKQSGAKRAFLYLAFGSQDHMRSTIEALKSAGIELVVFLSSFTVRADPASVPPADVIPYVHAQVELNLEAVFGKDGVVALRPGSFVGNNMQFKPGILEGEVKMYAPEAHIDNIVQEDIGRVGGTILAKGPPTDTRHIYLYGPMMKSRGDTAKAIASAIGKDAKIVGLNKEEAVEEFKKAAHTPEPVIDYMIRRLTLGKEGKGELLGYSVSPEEHSNVEKYSGTKATTLEEWLSANKQLFAQ